MIAKSLRRTLAGGSANYDSEGYEEDRASGADVEDARLWPLSAAEAKGLSIDLRQAPDSNDWWLRTPGRYDDYAGYVSLYGSTSVRIYGRPVKPGSDEIHPGMRPAFNLNLGLVYLTSAAEGGKETNPKGPDALRAVPAYGGTEWKPTVMDSAHKDFKVDRATKSGDVYTVQYSGAVTGPNEHISAILVDGDGNVCYYGRIEQPASASGKVTINISGMVDDLSRPTPYVFNEQYNGNYKTDYTSGGQEVIPVTCVVYASADPTEGGTVEGAGTYDEDATATVVAAPAEGYDFVNWTEDGAVVSTSASYSFTVTRHRDLVAHFAKKSFAITFVDEDGTVLQSGAVEYGATPTFTGAEPTKAATAESTYVFAGWTPVIVPAAGDATYTATYEAAPIQSTLTFDLAGGTLDGKTGTFTVVANVGETVTLLAAPTREGHAFTCWKGSKFASGAEYKVEGDHSFTAEWKENAKPGPKPTQTPKTGSTPTSKSGSAPSPNKFALPKTGDSAFVPTLYACLVLAALTSIAGGLTLRRRDFAHQGKHFAR